MDVDWDWDQGKVRDHCFHNLDTRADSLLELTICTSVKVFLITLLDFNLFNLKKLRKNHFKILTKFRIKGLRLDRCVSDHSQSWLGSRYLWRLETVTTQYKSMSRATGYRLLLKQTSLSPLLVKTNRKGIDNNHDTTYVTAYIQSCFD